MASISRTLTFHFEGSLQPLRCNQKGEHRSAILALQIPLVDQVSPASSGEGTINGRRYTWVSPLSELADLSITITSTLKRLNVLAVLLVPNVDHGGLRSNTTERLCTSAKREVFHDFERGINYRTIRFIDCAQFEITEADPTEGETL